MKKILILLITITMVLSLAACGSQTSTDGGSDTAVAQEQQQETPDNENKEKKPLGDFSAQDFSGNTITKDIFKDYDLTMVNLWTTTCGYCIEEMPALNQLRDEFQDEGKSFNIISVCMDIGSTEEINSTNLEKAKEIIKKTGVKFPTLIPDKVLLEGRLKDIQAYPESFFVDKNGKVVSEAYVGAMPKNHWRVTINDEIEKGIK